MPNLDFCFSETQRNSVIAEQDFHTKSKRNFTSVIKFTKHDANSCFFYFRR